MKHYDHFRVVSNLKLIDEDTGEANVSVTIIVIV